MENMRVFRDGNQIVIVLENASEALEQGVRAMVNGAIPTATHLSAPRPMQPPHIDTDAMTEVRPKVKAKFIERQEQRASSDMRTVQITKDSEERKHDAHPAETPKQEEVPSNPVGVAPQEAPNVEQMNVFALRSFLKANQAHPALPGILMRAARTTDLSFVLNVRGEQELRAIARQLVG